MSFNVMFGIGVAVFIGAWFYSGSIVPRYSSSDEAGSGATVQRIQPFGEVRVAGQETGATSAVPATAPAQTAGIMQAMVSQTATVAAAATDIGLKTYGAACAVCHTAGIAGSPKLGDIAAWQPRIAQGSDMLYQHAIGGIGAMPAKGGRADLSDDAVKAAVDYIVNESSGS